MLHAGVLDQILIVKNKIKNMGYIFFWKKKKIHRTHFNSKVQKVSK